MLRASAGISPHQKGAEESKTARFSIGSHGAITGLKKGSMKDSDKRRCRKYRAIEGTRFFDGSRSFVSRAPHTARKRDQGEKRPDRVSNPKKPRIMRKKKGDSKIPKPRLRIAPPSEYDDSRRQERRKAVPGEIRCDPSYGPFIDSARPRNKRGLKNVGIIRKKNGLTNDASIIPAPVSASVLRFRNRACAQNAGHCSPRKHHRKKNPRSMDIDPNNRERKSASLRPVLSGPFRRESGRMQ